MSEAKLEEILKTFPWPVEPKDSIGPALKAVPALVDLIRKQAAEIARLQAKLDWLDNNTTFHASGETPVLAEVSKRIWYHATDDEESYPFSSLIPEEG